MKRILYSNYTKSAAVVLFILSIVSGALFVAGGIEKYCSEKENIYRFERDFSESTFLAEYLYAPENAVYNAYSANMEEDENHRSKTLSAEKKQAVENDIKDRLNNLYCSDKINYFVEWNGKVFTNCGAKSADSLIRGEFYSYAKRNNKGILERDTSLTHSYHYLYFEDIEYYDLSSSITVAANIKDDFAAECKAIWERQATVANEALTKTLVCVIIALLLLIYLIGVCGKTADGELKRMWLDNIWTEVHIISIGIGIFAVCICIALVDAYFNRNFSLFLMKIIMGAVSGLASLCILASLLSVIRNIKCKSFVQSSIVLRILRCCLRVLKKILKWLYTNVKLYKETMFEILSKKTGVILIGMLLIYTGAIGLCGIFTPESAISLLIAIFIFGLASFVLACRSKDLDEIKKGVSEVQSGNTGYKIPELKSQDMKILSNNINNIAKGIDDSVAAKVKAERLKTELITNVSHDIKTPITSIISYTELLSQTDGLPEEARDYVRVLAKKSERLKNLTQDLFDISKVQSGNEEVVFEKLDASLLVNQSLGEHDSEIQKSELTFCVSAPKELYISADGRKMSRVVSNLINNILKYSMKNTRVFITVLEKDDEIVMEFKNISSYPMDFNADEIVGRFVRADKSRSAEGNGLGLAIAKSYTEICGGKFEIITDGDMFKAILRFKKYI